MKNANKVLAFALALCALVVAVPAMAANFWVEPFNYSDGDLTAVSGGNWVTHSGTIADVQVLSGEAVVNQSGGVKDDNRSFPPRTNTDKTYACFRFKLPDVGGTPALGYFAHFKDATTFNYASRVYVAPFGNTFTLGLSVASFSGTPPLWGTALNYGQWYTVVISYDAANDVSELWVDPVNEGSPKLVVSDATARHFAVEAFALRQFSGNWIGYVDDLGVGTSFEDACLQPVPTQTSTWGELKGIYR